MVQSASLDIDASWFYMTSKVRGHCNIGHFGHFSHLDRKIGPLCVRNRTYNPWDYKTRAQELTSGAIRMFLSLFLRIWERFKDQMVWGSFRNVDFKGNFNSFHKFLYSTGIKELVIRREAISLQLQGYGIWNFSVVCTYSTPTPRKGLEPFRAIYVFGHQKFFFS